MKKSILLAISFAFLVLNLSAQAKKEKIVELLALMNTDKMVNAMVDNMTKMVPTKFLSITDARKDSLYKAYVKEETVALTILSVFINASSSTIFSFLA